MDQQKKEIVFKSKKKKEEKKIIFYIEEKKKKMKMMIKKRVFIGTTSKYLLNNMGGILNCNTTFNIKQWNPKKMGLKKVMGFKYYSTSNQEIVIEEAEVMEVIEGELPIPENPLELMRDTLPESSPRDVAIKSPRSRRMKVGQRILRASLADYNKEWDSENAEKAIQESITVNGVKPDPKSWAYLLQSCARKGDLKHLDKVLSDIKQNNIEPHPLMLNFLIITFGEGTEREDDLITCWKACGLTPVPDTMSKKQSL